MPVRDPRPRKHSRATLTDPRLEPNRDVVAVNRRLLKQAPPRTFVAADIESLQLATYRYTKNPPVLNDTLGYGEQIKDVFWYPTKENGLKERTRLSQRTRTGRQVLKDK
jgi:hypothetical protein